ncbi:restriction endonuclease subunit S [uncultured Agrococcus sp.]|uniref:restriction endonuclease subunit S n=1 Tax=uncultured Agrococcus sp. TaxID=382258 RepID=UPI0025D89A04|nr:restriction endonuclease subunit S [uncultured Agrococcus sp.]
MRQGWIPIRRIADVTNGGTPGPAELNWDGAIPWATPVDLGRYNGHTLLSTERSVTAAGVADGTPVVPERVVLLSTRAPIGYSVITREPTAFNQGCKGLRLCSSEHDPRFLRYAVESSLGELKSRGSGTTFPEVNANAVAATAIPWKESEEQRQIADYLDRETAEIDAFIRDQELLESMVRERYLADLEHHVTLGPILPIRRLRPIRSSGVSVNAAGRPAVGEEPGVLKTGAVSKGYLDLEENKAVLEEAEVQRLATPLVEDRVLVNRANTPALVGSAAYVSASRDDRFLSDKLWQIDFDASNKYIAYAMRSRMYLEQARLRSVGASASMQNLSYEDFLSVQLHVPGRQEQEEAVRHLDVGEGINQTLFADVNRAVALAKERRAALISAAVTGQIDVTAHHKPAAEQLEDDLAEAR